MIVLSLGAGRQSSTLYLMAVEGTLPFESPVAAIFADTGAEPSGVYEWLEKLKGIGHSRIPINVVSAGNLETALLDGISKGNIHRLGQPPFYVKQHTPTGGRSADRGGMLWRQCTSDFKLRPLRKETRRLMLESGERSVTQYIGISRDEAHRMKPSGVKYITNFYPLVEMGMTVTDCTDWLATRGMEAPRSSCYFCPYKSNQSWREQARNDPGSHEKAIRIDEALRTPGIRFAGVTGEMFVHRSFIPLEAVDMRQPDEVSGQTQIFMDGFGNECEGLCGV